MNHDLADAVALRHTDVLDDDGDLWHTGDANRLETIRSALPHFVEHGETIVIDGRPHFKSARTLECPTCRIPMHRGTTTLQFKHAPQAQQQQDVEGWVCACGEAYVPGDVARAAFKRAMHSPNVPAADLDAARRFVQEVGGIEDALAALHSLKTEVSVGESPAE